MHQLKIYVLLVIFSLSTLYSQKIDTTSIEYFTKKFNTILKIANSNYVDSVDLKRIVEKGFSSMLNELDPNSQYFNSEYYSNLAMNIKGSAQGIGIQILNLNDTITVTWVFPNSSADSSGLKKGDKILFINSQNTNRMNTGTAMNLIFGTDASICNLIVKRKKELLEFSIKRREHILPSLTASFVKDSIGLIKISHFSKLTYDEFLISSKSIFAKNPKFVILDLRDNSGGLVDVACKIADEFIKEGEIITDLKVTNLEYAYKYISKSNGIFENIPFVVLINQNSASASEIIAGAVQDLDRGLIIGDNSFGKGTVQRTWEFGDSSAFRITIGYYQTPLGRIIQSPRVDNNVELDQSANLTLGKEKALELKKIISKFGTKTKVNLAKTRSGRTLFSLGGINPDIKVIEDTLTLLTNVIKSKGYFVEFSHNLLENNLINEKFTNNFDFFDKYYEISDAVFTNFLNLVKAKNVWNEQMFQTDKDMMKLILKASIAFSIWGENAYHNILFHYDDYIKSSIENYSIAREFIIN